MVLYDLTAEVMIRCVWLYVLLGCVGCLPSNPPPPFDFVPSPQVVAPQLVAPLALGSPVPDFRLPAAEGHYYTLSDFGDSDWWVVVFCSNSHPRFGKVVGELRALRARFGNNVAVAMVSSDSPAAKAPEHYRQTDLGDGFEDMKERYRELALDFAYLYDGDSQTFTRACGVQLQPTWMAFDGNRVLRVVGSAEMVASVVAGERLGARATPAGDSIVWSWQVGRLRRHADSLWARLPVTLSPLAPADFNRRLLPVQAGFSVVNVWATWCAPCLVELPELARIHRSLAPNAALLTLNTDPISDSAAVRAFLSKHHIAVANYQYHDASDAPIRKWLGGDWAGELPFTVILNHKGETLYRHQGIIDPLLVKRKLLSLTKRR